ncbi:MAG: ABC transporter ATP-binding protein, partial [Actinomycetota bacterium]
AGPVSQVLAAGRATGVVVRVAAPERAAKALKTAKIDARIEGDLLHVAVPPADAATVTKTLAAKRMYVSEIRPDEVDLETVFLQLTSEEPAES